MAWTNEQQQAITLRNSSLIVSAAAGSGKTSVLVERLIQILSDPTEKVFADRMIVVTFTNDAAAEMKQRLQTAFEKRIAEEPENRWLRQQQLLLPAAKISTINAFCFDLIREHLGDGEITSSFRVMDETEQDLLFRAAVDEVLNRWYTERAAEMQLLWNAFCNHTDQALEELLLELKTFLASIPFPEQWKQQVLQRFSVPDAENPDYLEFLKLMQERAAVLTDEVERLYVLSEDLYEEKNNVAEWMSVDFDTMHALLHALQQQPADAEQILKIIQNHLDARAGKRYPTKRKTVSSTALFEQIRDQRKQYDADMKALFTELQETLPYCREDFQAHRELLPILFALSEDIEQVLWTKKVQRNALSFDDGERMTLQLLSEMQDGVLTQSPLAKALSEEYQIIMIDEYQDANNKQDMIFKLLSHGCRKDADGTLQYGDNAFLVGDVKQSIYQFRLANPKNFLQCVRFAERESQQTEQPRMRCIKLNKNFRSSDAVLQFVNLIFSHIMQGTDTVSYDPSEWLYPGATGYQSLPEHQQGVEVAFLPETETADFQVTMDYPHHSTDAAKRVSGVREKRNGSSLSAGRFLHSAAKRKALPEVCKGIGSPANPCEKSRGTGILKGTGNYDLIEYAADSGQSAVGNSTGCCACLANVSIFHG